MADAVDTAALAVDAVGTDGAPLVITAVQGIVPVSAQVTPPPSREQIEKSVRSATRMFLAAYGTHGG